MTIMKLELTDAESRSGIVHGILEVIDNILGTKTICLDSVESSRDARIGDETCFEVRVVTGHYYREFSNYPLFLKPTFEDSSTFQCLVGKYCHVHLWTSKLLTKTNCPVLKSDENFESGVFIIPPLNQTLFPCMYDVVLRMDQPANKSVCFSLNDGMFTEKRCYIIQFSFSLSVKGSCAQKSCSNGGFCDGHEDTRKCFCRVGFSGDSCSTEFGIPQEMHTQNIQYPLLGNVLLPKRMNCPLNEECQIQLLITGKTGFYITTSTDSTSVAVKEIKEARVSKDFLATITVVNKKTGSHQLCVGISPDRYSIETDKVCCSISTQNTDYITCEDVSVDDCSDPAALNNICSDPTTATFCRKSCNLCHNIPTTLKNTDKQLFIGPSPTNVSLFTCSADIDCHVLLYLKRGHNNLCPEVSARPVPGSTVHIFRTPDCDNCSVDVLIHTSISRPTQRAQLCVEASDYNSGLDDLRCYFVDYEIHASRRQTLSVTHTTTSTSRRTLQVNLGNVIG
ncbi:uncharacterized protein LOC134233779 [Saccostrea cucullata]|uniref:uncharacterized protein LOC134233779 n=2 Tax=Saccostrea cuccullata TaxID=36930 RepID=UPI002ECFB35D